jgi:hypothetical protein
MNYKLKTVKTASNGSEWRKRHQSNTSPKRPAVSKQTCFVTGRHMKQGQHHGEEQNPRNG